MNEREKNDLLLRKYGEREGLFKQLGKFYYEKKLSNVDETKRLISLVDKAIKEIALLEDVKC